MPASKLDGDVFRNIVDQFLSFICRSGQLFRVEVDGDPARDSRQGYFAASRSGAVRVRPGFGAWVRFAKMPRPRADENRRLPKKV